jgi:uncharacterized protein (TIGR03492 family)
MKILFISNGYGEDLIASNLIKAFAHLALNDPKMPIDILPLPLVGSGQAYTNAGYPPLLTNSILPSGGFIKSFSLLAKDIKHGLLRQIKNQLFLIRQISKQADFTICIGDVYALLISSFCNKTPKYFLPTAKSNLIQKHSFLETLIIRKLSTLLFPRDLQTTDYFHKMGLNASFYGNPIIACLPPVKALSFPNLKATTIALLPGSREEAYANLAHMLKICAHIYARNDQISFILAKSNHLSLTKFSHALPSSHWQFHASPTQPFLLHKPTKNRLLISEAFTNVLLVSKLVIGLSGTANEQAVYIGKNVLTFPGFGPQSSKTRFLEQKRLLGSNLIFFDNNDPLHLAQKTLSFLQTHKIDLDVPSLSFKNTFTHITQKILQHFSQKYARL